MTRNDDKKLTHEISLTQISEGFFIADALWVNFWV
jgi:hypothetical protein